MAVHPCPRCKRLIPVGVQYCEECRPLAEAQTAAYRERAQAYRRAKTNRDYNKRRDPKYLAFYRSKEWRLLSKTKLQACGYKCEAGLDGCHKLAVEVHHIKPIKTEEGWHDRLNFDGLLGVCVACHNILDGKTKGHKAESGVVDIKSVKKLLKQSEKD